MTTRRKERFCGDTLNTFKWEDPKYHWSRAYKCYSRLWPPERNSKDISTSGISKACCVLEVFDATKLVSWYIDKYEKNHRIIELQGQSPISLAPSTLKKMFRLPGPMMIIKVDEAKEFLKTRNGGWDLLQQYLEDPMMMPNDLSTILVS